MVYGIGISGTKYPTFINNQKVKEYDTWQAILRRCYSKSYHKKCPTYKTATVCDEWLYYERFYEWITSQENYQHWKNNSNWAIDKDIICKGNTIYAPEYCCLVPQNVNKLFIKSNATRGELPIGIANCKNGLQVYCRNPFTDNQDYLGIYTNIADAFNRYKTVKEKHIKDVAIQEYTKGFITLKCYEAMMNYKVEITD